VKVESLIFGVIAFFCVAASVVYGFWAKEPIGTTALLLSGGLTGLIGGFFWFVSRRIDARPEDRKDADIADGAGELGFFSPSSYWPFALALAAASMGLALAFWYSWFIVIAGVALLVTIGGLLFEYYVGQNATHSNAPHL
jgi:putative Mn2+ efflux pump MntP